MTKPQLHTLSRYEEIKEDFISLLAETGNATQVCETLQVSRMTAYAWRHEFPEFKEAWDAAKALGMEGLEDIARHRARESSDNLLMFLLRGGMPEKYRERRESITQMTHQGPGGQPLAMHAAVNITIAGVVEDEAEA